APPLGLPPVPIISADTLTTLAQDLFVAAGVPPEDAAVVATSLVEANLAGHDSHGVIRVVQYVQALADGLLRAGVTLNIVSETPAVLVADGQWGLGQVQAHRLLRALVPRARALGVAAGTLRQCGHVGRLGEYGEAAARQGLALFATVNNHGTGRLVAPPGGVEGRLGTNPLCLAAPGGGGPPGGLGIRTSLCAAGQVRACL